MSNKGKNTCKILKDIRRQIAQQNDINLIIEECTYKGECLGTCPRCEAEVSYLEKQLEENRKAGKTLKVAGISAAMISLLAPSCVPQHKVTNKTDTIPDDVELLAGEVMYVPDSVEEVETPSLDSASCVPLPLMGKVPVPIDDNQELYNDNEGNESVEK